MNKLNSRKERKNLLTAIMNRVIKMNIKTLAAAFLKEWVSNRNSICGFYGVLRKVPKRLRIGTECW